MNLAITNPPVGMPVTHTPPAKLQKAAQDFESVLFGTLLESLQKTFAGTPDEGPAGSSDYAYMSTQALASAMTARGGIGIARLILKHMQDTKVPRSG